MKDSTQTKENRNSREIQEDIRGARDDMDQTLDSLNDRLSPRALINSLLDWFEKGDSSNSQALLRKPKQLAGFVRDNPVPALLTGIGVAWLIAESQSDDDESDFDRFRADHDLDEQRVFGYGQDIGKSEGPSGEPRGSMTPPSDSGSSSDEGESTTDKLKDKLSGAREQIAERGDRAKSAMRSWAAHGRQSGGRASGKVKRGYANAEVRVKEAVEDYPLGFGAGFIGLGLLAGLLLPRSEVEDEWFGESADEIKDTATDKGTELLERGQRVAGRVADEASDEAERQGLTVDNAANALESAGKKVESVVKAGKEEGKQAAQDENLNPDDLKSEAQSEAKRGKDKGSDRMAS